VHRPSARPSASRLVKQQFLATELDHADNVFGSLAIDLATFLARIDKSAPANFAGVEVVPGMPAEVYSDGGSRTMMQYLFDPLAVFMSKSMRED
jgi:hypothetical protein